MLVLGFDSAGAGLSVALWRDGRTLAAREAAMERGQAEALLPMIETVMAEAGEEIAALDLIGVTVGPGSFTGLRIGIAAARGLSVAAGIPAIGITSFSAVAAQFPASQRPGRDLLVAIDTKRDDFYLQIFGADNIPLSEGILLAAKAVPASLPVAPLLVAGDAAARLVELLAERDERGSVAEKLLLAPGSGLARAADIARLTADSWRSGVAVMPPRPYYLRAPDTTLPRL